eukprot:6339131-Pyramimonas_sp.AAC.1
MGWRPSAEAVGPAAAAHDSEWTCSSESTDADLGGARPVTGDMDLAPGTLVSYHSKDIRWLGAEVPCKLDNGHYKLAAENRAKIEN